MQRRQLLKSMAGVGAGSLLLNTPINALAKKPIKPQVINYKNLFNQALAKKPELIGFANIENNFPSQLLAIEGTIPNDLSGTFYRNGPAKHERGEQRYQHLFEGDGMLQRFQIVDGKISHHGKFITTPKFKNEQQQQQFLYSGPDTKLEKSLAVSSADMINTANTNVIAVGDDIWALWEAGSATKLDAKTLDYQEQITLGKSQHYDNTLKGLPFSAHPKVDPNGDIWNFGLHPSGHIVLYHLSARGSVKQVKTVNARYKGAMLHDFLITHKHILLILPSLNSGQTSDTNKQGYFSGIGFDDKQPMRVLVISKSDLILQREYELDAGFAFHYGNAWEEPNGTIHFDASLYKNIDVLHHLSDLMKGQQNPAHVDAKMTLFTLHHSGKTTQSTIDGNSEFPRICSHLVGLNNQEIYHLSSEQDSLWSDTVSKFNTQTGKTEQYVFGKDYLVEEHVPVCPQQKEGTGYLIGTALHVPSKRTCLNIFAIENLAAGPMARAWLPHHLPLGFHGNFVAA